jgi:4a-hydroxytetrahydrobiopterin dehydratase
MNLTAMKCTPWVEGTPPLTRHEIRDLQPLVPGWVLESGRLVRRITFPTFLEAVKFLTQVAMVASEEGHCPDIAITEHRHVTISWYTHAAGGLTGNDFIMAAKISKMAKEKGVGI